MFVKDIHKSRTTGGIAIPMKNKPRVGDSWLRFFAFFIIPVLVLTLANDILLKRDATAYYTFRELQARDDIELALMGSSIVFNNVNPNIVTQITGKEAFDVSSAYLNLPGIHAAAKYMYKRNQPEHVVLILEQEMLIDPRENIQAQLRMMPLLHDPMISLSYYIENCLLDGKILDRLLMFRTMPISSMEDLRLRRLLEQHPEEYYGKHILTNTYGRYEGHGFTRIVEELTMQRQMEYQTIHPEAFDTQKGLREQTVQSLLNFKKLCEKHGSKLLIIMAPTLTVRTLSHDGIAEKNRALADFCREYDIPYIDFTLAKPEFMPNLDPYYFDWNHLNGTGADLYSRALGECLNLYFAGENIDHLFYSSVDEYLLSIDFITNAWITERFGAQEDTYTAACNRGNGVPAQYCFMLKNADGSMTPVRDYSEDPVLTVPAGTYRDKALCAFVRNPEKPESTPVFFELTVPRNNY